MLSRRSLPWLLAVLGVVPLPGVGRSEEPSDALARETAELALRFVEKKDRLQVSDGRRSADLGIRASKVVGFARSKDRAAWMVRYTWEAGCLDEEMQASFSAAQLRAYLENAEALRAHEKQDYARAEPGFAKAVALFPTFKKAVFNLACAQTRQGKREAAVVTLAGYLREEAAETYAHVAGDADLAPLLETPAFTACRSKVPGTARITLRKDGAAYPAVLISKDKGLLATFVESTSWGGVPYDPVLAVFDLATGKELFTKVLVGPANKSDEPRRLTSAERKAMEPRLVAFNRFLADFGFSAAQHLVEGVVGQGNAPTMRFPGSGVGLVLSRREDKARVMRKNEILQELDVFGPGPSFQKGWYLANEKLLLFTWHVDEPEGCAFEGERAGAAVVNLAGK